MRLYTKKHKYTCGIDLHGNNSYVCIFDIEGKKLLHKKIKNEEAELIKALKDYREDLIVSLESTYNWYWVADFCQKEGITFVLGHAQYMRSIHQDKSKNDRVDSEKIARLTMSQYFPQSYAYPLEMRKVRDLLRRRLYFVRERAALKGHTKIVGAQYNIKVPQGSTSKKNFGWIMEVFSDPDLRMSILCNQKGIIFLDGVIREIEKYAVKRAQIQDQQVFEMLQTVVGIGPVLGMTILYELHDLKRFKKCQDFMSYARLVKCEKTSNDKKVAKSGRKIGNPYLKWACTEVAMHMVRINKEVEQYQKSLEQKYGKAGSWSRITQKIGRTIYYMLKNKEEFDMAKFLNSSKEAMELKCHSLEPQEVAMVVD